MTARAELSEPVCTLDLIASVVSTCPMCEGEFSFGYRGFWCSESCERLSQVTTLKDMRAGKTPPRDRIEEVYGPDAPEWEW